MGGVVLFEVRVMDRRGFQDLIDRVQALYAAGKLHEARKALESTPVKGQPGWHFVLARICLDLDDVVYAVHYGTKAVSLAPQNADYRALLAVCLYAASKEEPVALDVAEIEAARALEIDPQTPTADNTLGLVLLAQGRRVEARACFERAVEKAPSDPAPIHNLKLCA
jgi:Flp pilus assembly protein TadD